MKKHTGGIYMGKQLLQLSAFAKNQVSFHNKFYGHSRHTCVQINKDNYTLQLHKHDMPANVKIDMQINGEHSTLYLEHMPMLSFFEPELECIDLQKIPKEYQALTLYTASQQLLNAIEEQISLNVTYKNIEYIHSQHISHARSVDFLLSLDGKHINSGQLLTTDKIIIALAKHLPTAKKLHNLYNIHLPYYICIGDTTISKNEYHQLQQNDIIFFDEHILDKNKTFDIHGLYGVQGKLEGDLLCVDNIF